jgi:hypothetical protein
MAKVLRGQVWRLSTTADSGSTSSTVRVPRITAGEIPIVPPRLTSRVGLEPNPPPTRPLTHKPPRLPALCFRSLRNVFDRFS